MSAQAMMKDQTVPAGFQPEGETFPVVPPRKVLRAGPKAREAWDREVKAQEEINRIQAQEREALHRHQVESGIAETSRLATARGEKVVHAKSGALEVDSRDGLRWLWRKNKISHHSHYDAALRFRADWEKAYPGVKSSLGNLGNAGGGFSYDGPTHEMMVARGAVEAALEALPSPMLHHYAINIAALGEMLTKAEFAKGDDVRTHYHACAICFDILARHYGMIR